MSFGLTDVYWKLWDAAFLSSSYISFSLGSSKSGAMGMLKIGYYIYRVLGIVVHLFG